MEKTAGSCISPQVLRFPRLYPIVDAEILASRGLALSWFVEKLRDAGVTMLQYRDKRGTDEEILRNAKVIGEVFRGQYSTLVMNDSPVLAMLSDWNAVHVGQGDASIEEARAILQPGGIVGISTHTPEQVQAVDVSSPDYIAIGPVFETSSKADAEPTIGLEGVKRARQLTTRPLVAIGGITPENAADVIRAGADSVAVIGALARRDEEPGSIVHAFQRNMPRPERKPIHGPKT
jgi:thiamine-phosphate pyrophosphorylase